MATRNLVIAVLAICCGVLAYLVLESQKPGIAIKAPGVDIRAK